MNSSDQNPKLPMWIFIASDLALMGTAALFAAVYDTPYSATVMVAIVTLVGLGAIVGLVPIVLLYERQKNEALDERQRALESLARNVNASAEQISIAAAGLRETAELALKNLRMAEHLPHKLQEKVAEFQAQLSTTVDAEKEELERELLALRTSESERLETVSQRIAKSAGEWTKLEATTHQHLTAANDAVAKLALGTAGAIGKAQAAAEQALAQARTEAARGVGEVSGQGVRTIEIAKSAALAELDAKLAAAAESIVQRVTAALGARTLPPSISTDTASTATPASGDTVSGTASSPTDITDSASATLKESATAQPPKRPRKTRREETAGGEPTAPGSSPAPSSQSSAAPTVAIPAAEPLPVPAQTIPEVAPIAPATAEPFSHHTSHPKNGASAHVAEPVAVAATAVATAPAPRKRTPRVVTLDEEPGLGLALDDASSASMSEGVVSSDGATRLLVTAYIGIGNRLFIRGNGPGLTWEKGVPLQFVSIGKWRWETNEASAPVEFKLYKNDDLECSALGQQSVEPGRQQEVTAAF